MKALYEVRLRSRDQRLSALQVKLDNYTNISESLKKSIKVTEKFKGRLSHLEKEQVGNKAQLTGYQQQLEQTLKQLASVNADNIKKSKDLAKVEQSFRHLKTQVKKQKHDLTQSQREQEKLTDQLFEEKKLNIKLMKQMQEIKSHLAEFKSANPRIRDLKGQVDLQTSRMSDQLTEMLNERKTMMEKNRKQSEVIDKLKMQQEEMKKSNAYYKAQFRRLLETQEKSSATLQRSLVLHPGMPQNKSVQVLQMKGRGQEPLLIDEAILSHEYSLPLASKPSSHSPNGRKESRLSRAERPQKKSKSLHNDHFRHGMTNSRAHAQSQPDQLASVYQDEQPRHDSYHLHDASTSLLQDSSKFSLNASNAALMTQVHSFDNQHRSSLRQLQHCPQR